MNFFSCFQRQTLRRLHNVPLPAEANLRPIFQSWYTFDPSSTRWTAIDPGPAISTNHHSIGNSINPSSARDSRLVLVTWNVDTSPVRAKARISALISHMESLTPVADVVFLQEVSRPALSALLASPWLQDCWYSSEVGPANWEGQSFASMTLLSKSRFSSSNSTLLSPIWRIKYPSRFGLDALCCDVFLPSPPSPSKTAAIAKTSTSAASPSPQPTRIHLVNVHLDSLAIEHSFRPHQLSIIGASLRDAGHGLVAGDFNPVLPKDHTLLHANNLVDAWTELHSSKPGYTWGVDGTAPYPPGRLDKVAMFGLDAYEIELIPPSELERGRDWEALSRQSQSHRRPLMWSDHHGLQCTFGLADPNST